MWWPLKKTYSRESKHTNISKFSSSLHNFKSAILQKKCTVDFDVTG